jgi:FtsP/CotA-like multicopper oxidase with cupredoxin domain
MSARRCSRCHWYQNPSYTSSSSTDRVQECPIAPGKTRQYVFKCTQFGTTWYHSHWSAQYAEGTLGTLIIVSGHYMVPDVLCIYLTTSRMALRQPITMKTLGPYRSPNGTTSRASNSVSRHSIRNVVHRCRTISW